MVNNVAIPTAKIFPDRNLTKLVTLQISELTMQK